MDILIPRGRRRLLCGMILRGARAVIANSRATKTHVAAYGVLPARVHVITPGVEHPAAPPVSVIRLLNERHRLTGKRVLLTVGRLVARKNHAQVISVLPKLRQAFPNLVYVVVGDGPERQKLQRQAASLGLADAVVFTGAVTDAERNAWYELAEIFVLTPTHRGGDVEGFGIAYLEAAAHGKPVVAANVEGVDEAVANGISGILVDNHSALLEAIVQLLKNPSFAHRLGFQAQDRAFREFDWSVRAKKIAEIFS